MDKAIYVTKFLAVVSITAPTRNDKMQSHLAEEEDFISSANQLGCTDVPGLSVTWSKTSVLSVYHV